MTATGVRPQVLPSPLRVLTAGLGRPGAVGPTPCPLSRSPPSASRCRCWSAGRSRSPSTSRRGCAGHSPPLLVASQTLPIIAIAPLLIIWFGFGLLPKVVVIALVTFFPIAVGLIEGFASTPRAATNLLRSMGASRWQRFRLVRLPQALPSFFTALRIGITYAVTGAIFAEYVGADGRARHLHEPAEELLPHRPRARRGALTAVLSVALFALTYLVQRLVVPGTAVQLRRA